MNKKYYTVSDIAELTSYNRSTVTRWIAKHGVKHVSMHGSARLYDAQVLETFKKTHADRSKGHKSDVQRMRERIAELEQENKRLNKKVEDYTDRFYKLADQAQQLDLTNKSKLLQQEEKHNDAVNVEEVEPHLRWWQKLLKKGN